MHLIWKAVSCLLPPVLFNALALCTNINKFYVNQNGSEPSQNPPLDIVQAISIIHCVVLCNINRDCKSGSYRQGSQECVRSRECRYKETNPSYNFAPVGDTRTGKCK